jgi:lipoprotein-anchoring transpeptidase ErfK/SrfK
MMCRQTCPFVMALAAVGLIVATPVAAPQNPSKAPARSRPTQPAVAPADSPELRLQVWLDRAGFSPGEIDGHRGLNTTRALQAFAEAHRLKTADEAAIVRALSEDASPVVTTYAITAADAAGPFTPDIPSDLEQQATLPALNYSSLEEATGEKFHTSPALLKALNPGMTLEEGAEIQVPNVGVTDQAATPAARAARVTVSRSGSSATAYDEAGKVIFYAPVTSGSAHDPLPLGTWKVTGIQRQPSFNYNPDLFWDANPSHTKAKIAPGPNNPVGVVWIDISKEHYGLHGTPEPSTISRTTSHGCVRLTNWDASRLAGLVKTGTPVIFER